MAATTPNKILLHKNGGSHDYRPHEEIVVVGAAVTPGDLLELGSTGCRPNQTENDADSQRAFAEELPYLDPRNTSGNAAIDVDYAVAAYARVIYPKSGDIVYGWLDAGENVAKFAALGAGATDGTVKAYASGRIIAFAHEAVNNAAGGSPVRIKMRVA